VEGDGKGKLETTLCGYVRAFEMSKGSHEENTIEDVAVEGDVDFVKEPQDGSRRAKES
jgi:hypothetical protein